MNNDYSYCQIVSDGLIFFFNMLTEYFSKGKLSIINYIFTPR